MSSRQNLVVEQVEAVCRFRLRLTIKLSLKGPDLIGCFEAHRQSPPPLRLRKRTRSQGPSLRRSYPGSAVLCPCPTPARSAVPACRAHYPGGSRRVHVSIASPLTRPSPFCRRVGIRTSTFEACSGFTHVTARRIAQPPRGGLCHEASIRLVTHPNRSSATRAIDNSLGGSSLHW